MSAGTQFPSNSASMMSARLVKAADHLLNGELASAETLCRDVLREDASNVSAMCMLAGIGLQLGLVRDPINLLERCLELAPDYELARLNYANALSKKREPIAALQQLDILTPEMMKGLPAATLKASVLAQMGRHAEAIGIYDILINRGEQQAGVFLSRAHALKTIGKSETAIDDYKRAIELSPSLGEAYWSLANLKLYKFSDEQIENMKAQAAMKDIGRQDFVHLCFALGKALEDRKSYEDAFRHYARGNKIQSRLSSYQSEETQRLTDNLIEYFTAERLKSSASQKKYTTTPIFVVGLPRSGSTLVEQILASHSMVEGTQELPIIMSLARQVGRSDEGFEEKTYPHCLGSLSSSQIDDLGYEYVTRAAAYRETDRPFFIDKMPNNFAHVGFIKTILPHAKIIDARRHPMDCCFSVYKQLFAKGQYFSYDLDDLAAYYRDYIRLMDHWDAVLPDQVFRVLHERLVQEPVEQISLLLKFCGLEFEPACLNFHENQRPVRTASSEQVRQPLNKDAFGRWKKFEQHLQPLRHKLADIVDAYENVLASAR